MREYPIVVSFAAGADEYHHEAERLENSCRRIGLEYDIVHYRELELDDWGQLCRMKISFYQEMLQKHHRPILWVDGDSQFIGPPKELANFSADLAAVPRRGLRSHDPYSMTRMWQPDVLCFGYTERSLRFVEHLQMVNEISPHNVTDDYVLQEAWATFDDELAALCLPKTAVAWTPAQVGEYTWVRHGSSGSVGEYTSRVLQHGTMLNRGQVLTDVAEIYSKQGQLQAAEAAIRAAADFGFDLNYKWSSTREKLFRKQGRHGDANKEIRRFVVANPESDDGHLAASRLALREKRYAAARHHALVVAEKGGLASGRARSVVEDIDREQRASELGISAEQRPPLWWMRQPFPGNLGDILNPIIIERVTGVPPRFTRKGSGILAIGSTVKFAASDAHVWGTGTPRIEDTFNPHAHYHAVRGPITASALRAAGAQVPEVLGDPALLLPYIYRPTVEKQFELGVIPHLTHRDLVPVGDGVADLDLNAVSPGDVYKFIDQLCKCRVVLSSSLHGIILANAYGIPARWVTFSNEHKRISGDGTKYWDYFGSVGLPVQEPYDLGQEQCITSDMASLVDLGLPSLNFDAEALLDAFPWDAFQSSGLARPSLSDLRVEAWDPR